MKELIIIGAGQSGIACAIEAQKKNLNYLLIDKHDSFGGSWLDYPEKTRLFSPWFASMPHKKANRVNSPNEYPLRDDISLCLQNLGTQEKVNFCGGVTLLKEGISYNNQDKSFLIKTDVSNLRSRRVILALGPYSHIKNVNLQGEENFKGIVKHAHSYKKPEKYPDVRKVVVVGSRNSAIQIAYDFLKNGKEVILSFRGEKIFWIKKKIFGKFVHYFLHNLKLDYVIDFFRKIFSIQDKTVFDDGTYQSIFDSGKILQKSLPVDIKGNDITWEDGTVTNNIDLIIKAVGYEKQEITLKRYIDKETYTLFIKKKIPLILCGMGKTVRSSVRWAERNAKNLFIPTQSMLQKRSITLFLVKILKKCIRYLLLIKNKLSIY